MKIADEILKQDFGEFDDLFDRLSECFLDNKKILVAVSGGPDSMFLSILILKYFELNNLDLNNLYFVHCNHKTREETEAEEKFFKEFFTQWKVKSEKLKVVVNKSDEKKTENDLRQWRYKEFQKIIDQNNIDFILTGHNLTDRIESSFMNMLRGSGLNGFVSMKFLDENNLLEWVKIVRPLLSYTKKEIEKYCADFGIPFVVDPTNLDEETSLRNKIRLSLFPQLADMSNKSDQKTNTFFDSMKKIYNELDEKNIDVWNLIEINKSDYRNSDFAFCWDVPLSFVSENSLLQILKKFGIFSEVTSSTLKEFVDFFNAWEQGHKYVNWVYLFLSHGKIYIIKAKENFWQKYIEKSEIIDKLWEMDIWKTIVNINDESLIWLEVRYPKEWDKIGSKSWSKYCINKKIPVFWRNFIPVVVDWDNILKYFYK